MVNTENELIKRDILHITKKDEGYPMHLKELSGSPAELYYIGSLPDDNIPSVAIIGARNCSGYGRQMAREFAREIAAAGIQVISGMARGIDGMAQQAAVSVGGKSYAVLGCGVDICYPKENKELYVKLMDSGGIISEYPPGIPARAEHFPLRNRIISGLADALLVIEARERSGTLITANMALEQGREIYALPGRVTDSLSYGCNRLIYDGAYPAVRPYEFIDEFLSRYESKKGKITGVEDIDEKSRNSDKIAVFEAAKGNVYKFLSAGERKVLGVLDYTPKSVSEIFYELSETEDIKIQELLQLLTKMTVKHLIDCVDGCNYSIKS